MASIQYYDVIIRPVITEKSMADMGEKKNTFLRLLHLLQSLLNSSFLKSYLV